MRSTTFALPLLASLAVAQPHKQHQHRHAAKHIEARNEPVIEWVTEYAYTTEIVPVTTTIWVSEGFVPPAASTSSSETKYKNTVPAQFYEPVKQPSTTAALPTTVAPPPAPVQPTTTSSPPPPAPVVEEKPTEQPVEQTVQQAPAETPVAVAPSSSKAPEVVNTPQPQAQTSAPASNSGSSSGPCSSGSSCNGDMTHYEAGLGACGWESDGSAENVLALSHLLMGTQSNGNPYCGKTVTVKLNGKSIIAKVVDKCMGCEIHAIDLSDKAFASLEDMGVGRTQVEWYFNN